MRVEPENVQCLKDIQAYTDVRKIATSVYPITYDIHLSLSV